MNEQSEAPAQQDPVVANIDAIAHRIEAIEVVGQPLVPSAIVSVFRVGP